MALTTNLTKGKRTAIKIIKMDLPGILPSKQFDGILRIASFNIAHGRGTAKSNFIKRREMTERLLLIASLLNQENIDIVLLNEVDFNSVWSNYYNQAEFIAGKAGFPYIVEQENYNFSSSFFRIKFGNALLSKFPIKNHELINLPLYSRWEASIFGAKKGFIADVSITTDLRISIFATHLDDRSEHVRIRCAEKIIAHGQKSPFPFFLIGDLNSSPSFFPGAEKDKSGISAMDIMLKNKLFTTLPKKVLGANQMTFSSMRPRQVIDWILVPWDWKIMHYKVPNIELSDHRPVIMHVRPQNKQPD